MTEQSNKPQDPPTGNEQPEVFSVSQDQDGGFHLSRRDLLYVGAAVGGVLLIRGVCPRFAARATSGELARAGMSSLPQIAIHTAPSIASNIAETLRQDDLVRLIRDRPDLGWVEVATRSGKQGWVKRSYLDFSRAVKSTSPSFGLSNAPTPTPLQTPRPPTLSVQLRRGDQAPKDASAAGQAQACGEAIQNGNFESGGVSWSEETTGAIIRNDWADPYQGLWVAWFGGPDADERLTQAFHVPANVQDVQTLEFYLKVATDETSSQIYDRFLLRFLDGGGNPISNDIAIANNTTPTNWLRVPVDLNGMAGFADQDIQVQFECVTNSINDTYFVMDLVSLDLACDAPPVYYVYLPVAVRLPTRTPTPTPTPSATPCPSHCGSDCPGYCSSDCSSDCSGDSCSSYCPSDCSGYCGWDCPSDCYSICTYYWP